MYNLQFTDKFQSVYKKITKSNVILKKQIQQTIIQLSENPFYPTLKTHKVDTRIEDNVYSSCVNGDIRIIWKIDENQNQIILVLTMGGHSGKGRVYKKSSF